MSLISERNVTCWDPTQVFAFSLKLLSKSRPWSISLERLQCRWVDSKICMILPSSARFLFSFSSIKFRQRFCCSQLVCERQWLAARCCKENSTRIKNLFSRHLVKIVHFVNCVKVSQQISTASKLCFNWIFFLKSPKEHIMWNFFERNRIAKSEGRILEWYWKDPELEDRTW